jgi:hypothetical protein
MEEIEILISKVEENNWSKSGDNENLLKKMLNNLRNYVNIKEKREDEIDENDKRFSESYEKGIEFLRNNIDNLTNFIKDENKHYEIFRIIRAEESVEFLFRKLLSEKDERCVNKIRDVLAAPIEKDGNYMLWFERFIPGLTPFLEKMSHKIVGRNSKYFWEVVENISNENIEIKTTLYKNRRKMLCGIKSIQECTEFILPERNEYFIAYPFSNKKIKDIIMDSFRERWQRIYGDEKKLTPITADSRIENESVLCNICKKIHYTKFGVYVLSKQRKTEFSNPNVMLELGIAMKIGKPYILIYKKGTRNIADLAGHIRFEYKTHKELKEKITKKEELENYLGMEA